MKYKFTFIQSAKLILAYLSDFAKYRKSHTIIYEKDNLEFKMLLLSHALEKGMSFKDKKNSWGG